MLIKISNVMQLVVDMDSYSGLERPISLPATIHCLEYKQEKKKKNEFLSFNGHNIWSRHIDLTFFTSKLGIIFVWFTTLMVIVHPPPKKNMYFNCSLRVFWIHYFKFMLFLSNFQNVVWATFENPRTLSLGLGDSPFFSNMHLYKAEFSPFNSTKITYSNRVNAETVKNSAVF